MRGMGARCSEDSVVWARWWRSGRGYAVGRGMCVRGHLDGLATFYVGGEGCVTVDIWTVLATFYVEERARRRRKEPRKIRRLEPT